MNRWIGMGNLTRDPEFKNVGTTNVCNFGIALNRQTKNGKETTFINIEAWGKTAENITKYFTKGKPILIEGRLKLDEWDDKTTHQKRSKLKVIAERFEFVGGNQQVQGPQPAAPPYNSTPAPPPPPPPPAAPASPFV